MKPCRHFQGRTAVIATMHGKEKAIAPALLDATGLKCLSVNNFNTDQYGTFTGQVARKENALDVCRQKCIDAIRHSGIEIGIASEGSFFPHPEIPFLTINEEWLVLVDEVNGWEISEKHVSSDTNLNGRQISDETELLEFAAQCRFPTHGLIVRKAQHDFNIEVKGLHDENALLEAFRNIVQEEDSAWVETDMRAMHNPTRMYNIGKTARLLAIKMNNCCPSCNVPGFGVVEVLGGLPCAQCGSPTRSVLAHVYRCLHCRHEEESKFPDGVLSEDPMHCDWCNP